MILITRPAPHGLLLCETLQNAGYACHWLPTLRFQQLPCENEYVLKSCDWVIFVSPEAIQRDLTLPGYPKIAAIGKGTAQRLASAGFQVTACPEQGASAEALLALPAFHPVKGQHIAIIKGKGGRKHLARTLKARGAEVTEIITYERLCPAREEVDTKPIHLGQISTSIITSGQGLLNLLRLAGKTGTPLLQQVPVIVISPRLADIAKRLGFRHIHLAASAQADDLLAVLRQTWPRNRGIP